jgi:hypothetical protein
MKFVSSTYLFAAPGLKLDLIFTKFLLLLTDGKYFAVVEKD